MTNINHEFIFKTIFATSLLKRNNRQILALPILTDASVASVNWQRETILLGSNKSCKILSAMSSDVIYL